MNITKWTLILVLVDIIPTLHCMCIEFSETSLACREINTTAHLHESATRGNFSQFVILNSELDVTTISSKHVVFVELYGCTIFQENMGEAHFVGLPKLQHLIIAHNNIRNLDTLSFHGNAELTILNLSHNNLKRIPIIKSDSLKQLDLSGNELTTLDMDKFVHLPKLEMLEIKHNCFTVIENNVHAVLHRAGDHSCPEDLEIDGEGSCLRISRICMEPSFPAQASSNETTFLLVEEEGNANASHFQVDVRENATNSSAHEEDAISILFSDEEADSTANETNSDQYTDEKLENHYEPETETTQDPTTATLGFVPDSLIIERTIELDAYEHTGGSNLELYATIAFSLFLLSVLILSGTLISFKIQSNRRVKKDERLKRQLRSCRVLPPQPEIIVGDLLDAEGYLLPVSMPGDNFYETVK